MARPDGAAPPWRDWRHVTKLDPDKSLPDGVGYADVCATGTSAVVVGGSTGVTDRNLADVLSACADAELPVFQEPSTPEVVADAAAVDGYLVPVVLNANDPFWLVGAHQQAVRQYPGHDWPRTDAEGYVVLNPDSTVATVTGADCDLDPADVAAYATVAEQLLGLDLVYLEYSGALGDDAVVAAAADALEAATLFYGGGVHDAASARAKATHADVVVVGNVLYDEGLDALQATVDGALDA